MSTIHLFIGRSTVSTIWVDVVKAAIVQRLYDTANGDYTPPDQGLNGVCWVIENAMDRVELRPMAQEVLAALTRYWGSGPNPLGDYMQDGNLWHGLRGNRRRTYAGLLAAMLEDARILVVTNPVGPDDGWRAESVLDDDMHAYLRGFDRFNGFPDRPIGLG